MYIPLLADEYNAGEGANNPDFVALSDTIGILEGARNSVLPGGSDPNFISHTKSTPASSLTGAPAKMTYTGPAPYGYDSATQPHAPFYLTEYKFDGSSSDAHQRRQKESGELYDSTRAVRSTSPCSLPRKTEGISSTGCPSDCI